MVCRETTEPAQLLLLPVKRQRKHIFAVHDLRQQTGRYDPAARQKCRRNGAFLHGNTGFLFFALTPAPGFAALLDWRPVFRAFVDRRVRVVPHRVAVPHPTLAVGAFLPRDVARWRKAHPTVQACQLIRHDAFPLCVSSILPHWERFTTILRLPPRGVRKRRRKKRSAKAAKISQRKFVQWLKR